MAALLSSFLVFKINLVFLKLFDLLRAIFSLIFKGFSGTRCCSFGTFRGEGEYVDVKLAARRRGAEMLILRNSGRQRSRHEGEERCPARLQGTGGFVRSQ